MPSIVKVLNYLTNQYWLSINQQYNQTKFEAAKNNNIAIDLKLFLKTIFRLILKIFIMK